MSLNNERYLLGVGTQLSSSDEGMIGESGRTGGPSGAAGWLKVLCNSEVVIPVDAANAWISFSMTQVMSAAVAWHDGNMVLIHL